MTTSTSEPPDSAAVRPPSGLLLGYATGSVGMGVWVTVPGLLLLFYLTEIVDVSPALAGLTILLPKLVDVLSHPFFGTVSDKQRHKRGSRLGMMWIGLLLTLAMVATFATPIGISGDLAALWVAVFYIVGNMLYASFQVPYLTAPSDLDISYYQRTRVMTFRTVLLLVGLLGVGVAAPAMVASGERVAYVKMAATLSVVILASGLVAIWSVRRLARFMTPPSKDHPSIPFRKAMRLALSERDFRILVISYLLTVSVTHLFLAGAPYFARYIFDSTKLTSALTGAFLGAALVAGPIWLRISRTIGKQRGILIAQTTFCVGTFCLYFASKLGLLITLVIIAFMGICFSGMQLFAYSMLPDVVRSAGKDASRAASYTGVWSATDAAGAALGPYVYSAVLAIGGFVSSSGGDEVAQTGTAIEAVLLGFTFLPAAIMVFAILVQRRYSSPT